MSGNWEISSMIETLFTKKNENPFVGLRPYESDEGDVFFGRDIQIRDLLQKLHIKHFLAIVGSSGCGKSSLIKAGVIPKLKAGFLTEARDHWIIATMRPSGSPLQHFVAAIQKAFAEAETEYEKPAIGLTYEGIVADGISGFVEKMRKALENSRFNLLILVDQFEELYTYKVNSEEQKNENTYFVTLLLALAREAGLPVYTIITMRSDYIGHCNRFFGLPELLNESQYLVPKLKWQQIREVIELPVKLYGQQINPGLLDLLCNDSDKDLDQLPVLQHCLMRTYENWIKDGKKGPVEFRHYEATGKLDGAICRHANEVYHTLDNKQKKVAEYLFKAITDFSTDYEPIRRPVRFDKLAEICKAVDGATEQDVSNVIEAFCNKSCAFLTASNTSNNNLVIDLAHESLMRQWDKMNADCLKGSKEDGWMKDEVRSADKLYWLSECVLWGKEYLRGLDVTDAIAWKYKQNPNEAWAGRYVNNLPDILTYIEKSEKDNIRAANKKRKTDLLIKGGVVALALAALVVAFIIFNNRLSDKNEALARAVMNDSLYKAKAEMAMRQKRIDSLIIKDAAQRRREDSLKEHQYIAEINNSLNKLKLAELSKNLTQIQADQKAKDAADKEFKRRTDSLKQEERKNVLKLTQSPFYQARAELISQDDKDKYVDTLLVLKYDSLNNKAYEKLLNTLNLLVNVNEKGKSDPNIALAAAIEGYDSLNNAILRKAVIETANKYLFYTNRENFAVEKNNNTRYDIHAVSSDNHSVALTQKDSIVIYSLFNGKIHSKTKIPILQAKEKTKVYSSTSTNPLLMLKFTGNDLTWVTSTGWLYRYNIVENRPPVPIGEIKNYYNAVTLSEDGTTLVSNHQSDKNMSVYNINGYSFGAPEKIIALDSLYPSGRATKVVISPDNKKVLLQYPYAKNYLLHLDSGEEPKQFTGKIKINFTPDGNHLIAVDDVKADTRLSENTFSSVSLYNLNGDHLDSSLLDAQVYYAINNITLSKDWTKVVVQYSETYQALQCLLLESKKDSVFSFSGQKVNKNNNKLRFKILPKTYFVSFTPADGIIGINNNKEEPFIGEWASYRNFSNHEYDSIKTLVKLSPLLIDDKIALGLISPDNINVSDTASLKKLAQKGYANYLETDSEEGLNTAYHLLKSYMKSTLNYSFYTDFSDISLKYFESHNAYKNHVQDLELGIKAGETKLQSIQDTADVEYEDVINNLSQDYGSLAWYNLFLPNADYGKVVEHAKKGLQLYPENDWIYTNLALGYLFGGRYNDAAGVYEKYAAESYSSGSKTFKEAFLSDFFDLEEAKMITPENKLLYAQVEKIKKYLKGEIKSLH